MAVETITFRPAAPVLPLSPAPTRSRASSTLRTAPLVGPVDAVRLSGMSAARGTIPATGVMDLPNRLPKAENPLLTLAQRQLMNAPAFGAVYRNFDLLSQPQQQAVLQKLERFQAKYPDFLQILARVPNPRYGEGFQFFFVPPKDHPRWKDVPASVRGTGGTVAYSGIVYSSPVLSVLKTDSRLKLALHALSQGAVDAVSALRPGKLALDVGGMFTDSGADTFAHEMGHVLHAYFMSNADQLELWALYTEAEQSHQGFITDYSRTNHMEFFAEGVEAYFRQDAQGNFYERDLLRRTNPGLYAFVRRQLEPGVGGPEPAALKSAWTITRGKARGAAQALQNLFSSPPA